MKNSIQPRTLVLILMIVLSGVWRLVVSAGYIPLSNFTPIGAMALFGGCYFANKWKAFAVPLATLWLSDLVLNYMTLGHHIVLFYDGFLLPYLSFALMVLIGMNIKKIAPSSILVAGVLAGLMHYIITDFGVWMEGLLYPKTSVGLATCYIAALPFLKNMLISNIVFSAALFGGFEVIQKRLKLNPQVI